MRLITRVLPAGLLILGTVVSARAAQSVLLDSRHWHDIPAATLTTTTNGVNAVSFTETNVSKTAPGGVNRDDWLVSEDGIGPADLASNTDYFRLDTDLVLTGNPAAPRKEAGLRIDNPVLGDFLFIVNTDAHEIVSFGGPGPFVRFNNPSFQYNSGDPIHMSLIYTTDGTNNGVILGANGHYSNFMPMFNLEHGFTSGSTIGGYFQINNDPANPTNSGSAAFTNISFVRGQVPPGAIPEPSSLALLGTGLVGLLGLRRRRA